MRFSGVTVPLALHETDPEGGRDFALVLACERRCDTASPVAGLSYRKRMLNKIAGGNDLVKTFLIAFQLLT